MTKTIEDIICHGWNLMEEEGENRERRDYKVTNSENSL